MPTISIGVYVKDVDFELYLAHKEEIQQRSKEMVRELLENARPKTEDIRY